jgi:chorismate mutase
MAIRAIRGATSVSENSAEEILSRTRAMVQTALQANRVAPEDIVSIVFVVTPDLDAVFPARAAREMGLAGVPLLDMVSPDVKRAMPRLVRMLLTWNTDRDQGSVTHVYLGEAEALRPDLMERSRASLGAPQEGGEPHW